jgi:hypothetical protein
MSKMDGLRAMREARYAENAARAKSTAPAAKKAGTTKPRVPAAPDSAEAVEPTLCGHRNMSGRSCTREHGHAAKSHRYS